MNLTKHDRKVLLSFIKPIISQTVIFIFFVAVISLFALVALNIIESDKEKKFDNLVRMTPYVFMIVASVFVLIVNYLKAKNYILHLRKATKKQMVDTVLAKKSDDRYAFDTTIRANNLILEEFVVELKDNGTIEIDKELFDSLKVGDSVLLSIAPISQKILDIKLKSNNL
ncbi:MAG: hypothetical protein JEY96_19590 [Bacteroidales bacterium]|nr:hypothetical protein [Bacteroidales bacterium]